MNAADRLCLWTAFAFALATVLLVIFVPSESAPFDAPLRIGGRP